ncbi:hypothetical protein ACFW0H_29055, partial [Pseudomonas sp. CR3202]|uniref:hypothetical protein n=1 Tax=Pseudomonas sp. CR3202 TaxID=3351532 RepID=UPI003BF0B4DF
LMGQLRRPWRLKSPLQKSIANEFAPTTDDARPVGANSFAKQAAGLPCNSSWGSFVALGD